VPKFMETVLLFRGTMPTISASEWNELNGGKGELCSFAVFSCNVVIFSFWFSFCYCWYLLFLFLKESLNYL
jgi:hypothetical protein